MFRQNIECSVCPDKLNEKFRLHDYVFRVIFTKAPADQPGAAAA